MHIEELSENEYKAYELFLQQHKGSMLYYTLKYKKFLETLLDCSSQYFVAIEGTKIVGVLPLMYKTGKYGKVVNSLPYYGSNGGILTTNGLAKGELLSKYNVIISEEDVAAATLITNPLDQNYPYENIPTDEKDYRIGQLSRIGGRYKNLEELMVLFHTKTRNTIRKPIKAGVRISIENDMFDFLQTTHGMNMASIGGLAKTNEFFTLVKDKFEAGKDYNIYLARLENEPLAALLVFYYGQVVEYYTPVVIKEHRHLQPLSLIIAQAIFDAAENDFDWWNWGGTWASQGGVYDFKVRWGTSEINYHYYITINNKEIYYVTPKELLTEYPGFYVLPFDKLKS